MVGLCRLCAEQHHNHDLTLIESDESEICKQLRIICDVHIRLSDPLPKFICNDCERMMHIVFLFYTRVRQSQKTLETVFFVTKIKEEQEEHMRASPKSADDEISVGSLQEAQSYINWTPEYGGDTLIQESDASISPSKSSTDSVHRPFEHKVPMKTVHQWDDKEAEIMGVEVELDSANAIQKTEEFSGLTISKCLNVQTIHSESHSSPPETKERPHKCTVCNKAFTYTKGLRVHMRTHTGERPFHCSICDSKFVQQGHLAKHMRAHSGERPYKCCICDSAFAGKSNLRSHLKRHTGERAYKCSICDCAFADKSNLKAHMRRHTGERPYKCTTCEYKFATHSDLKKHKRRHNGERPHKCSICDSAFADSSGLKNHMMQHTGERPHTCSICNSTFTRQFYLKRHMSRHTDKGPHKCAICNCAFAQKWNLKSHMRIHNVKR